VAKGTNIGELFAAGRLPRDQDDIEATELIRLRAKSNGTPLEVEDVVLATYSGGGGWGDPIDRDPQRVERDVSLGYVSAAVARNTYGVVLDDAGRVDDAGTDALRSRIREERKGWRRATAPRDPERQTAATGEPDRVVLDGIVACDRAGQRILACANCGERLSDYTGNYKAGLLVDEGPLTLVPRVPDPSYFLDDAMLFRRFCCPGCQTLLTNEIVREDEPIVDEFRLSDPSLGVALDGGDE
jgi:N-methylhydantoinase B